MPRRVGVETNPYLVPVYNPERHPCYKAPVDHVAARASMQVVGSADVTPQEFLKMKKHRIQQLRHEKIEQILAAQRGHEFDDDRNPDENYDNGADHHHEHDEYESDFEDESDEHENDIDQNDTSENENDGGEQHERGNHSPEYLLVVSPQQQHQTQQKNDDNDHDDSVNRKEQLKQQQQLSISRRLSEARHFADLHRKHCSECRFEHHSKLDGQQKKLFQKEYQSREKLLSEEYEIRKYDLKIRYMERHIQIIRHLEATRKERERAMRQAQREENQRIFDLEETTARNALIEQIYSERSAAIELGVTNIIINFITMDERIDRKDKLKVFRAERHMVNIAGHLRAEKIRRIEGAMFSLVKSEPNARRLLEAEFERGWSRLQHSCKENHEMVVTVEHTKRHQAQAAERVDMENQENGARIKTIGAAELDARDELIRLRNADRFRISSEQLKQKRYEVEQNEVVMRKSMEGQIVRQRANLFLKMLPSVEAGRRYEMRVLSWQGMKEIAVEFGMDFTTS